MTYQHILVPCDGSELSFSAVKQASAIAKAMGAKLTVMSMVIADPTDPNSINQVAPMLKTYVTNAYEKSIEALQQAKSYCLAQYELDVDTRIVIGEINAESIVTVAESISVDLVVMGSHGYQGFKKLVLGSLAQEVLASTELAVLVVKK